MLVCNVVGTRPNFMKIGPVADELKAKGIPQILVHTGQHYDENMSRIFFEELGLPEPDICLGAGSDTPTRQVAQIITAFEKVCLEKRPDLVVVGGDVNSTMAAALTAAKLEIPVAHVEAGLRSFDRSMPEEINRIVTDHFSELLFTTEASANQNLHQAGIPEEKIYFVGNCMIDTMLKHLDKALKSSPWQRFALTPGGYALLTLHRPSNVDNPAGLKSLISIINRVSERLPVIFPCHPRTGKQLKEAGIEVADSVQLCEPLPYLSFLGLMAKAGCVLTDSGGIQEETTVLKVPCLTIRENTERPVTVDIGTNRLVGMDADKIYQGIETVLAKKWPSGKIPPLWDGRAARRIVEVIEGWKQKE